MGDFDSNGTVVDDDDFSFVSYFPPEAPWNGGTVHTTRSIRLLSNAVAGNSTSSALHATVLGTLYLPGAATACWIS
ncbi:hypothetical protein AURDEDRAFT_112213 [Auricularia subglabra TFB-10046 SS5]|nr:hypothetical protein AURDEDRAFT_112213 [Auricularia subglabra TFB-10046 SS5]